MDIAQKPYAKWFEESIKAVAGLDPDSIGIVARSANKGIVFTGYYNADTEDMAVMAHHIYSDVIMGVVKANIETIRDAIDEEEDYEPDDSNLEMGFDPYLGCYTEDC